MAGSSLPLAALARRGTLSGGFLPYLRAAVVTCGPWIFTVLALAGVGLLHRGPDEREQIGLFTIVIIYNFAFSLVLASPIVLVVTRRLADDIYAGTVAGVSGMLVGSLALLFALQAVLAIPFYGFVVDLEPSMRILAIAGFFIVGGIWVAGSFLTARRRFAAISTAFGVGMGVAFGLGAAPGTEGAVGMLSGFTVGLAVVFFMMLARILADYPSSVEAPARVLGAFRQFWEFGLAGLFYVCGIWVDKWIMWSAPGRQVVAGAMPAHPSYDAAMFLAFLSIIPAMSVFFFCIETRFFHTYRRFYRDIGHHATLDRIKAGQEEILATLRQMARRVVIIQSTISYALILLAPQMIAAAGGGHEMIPIFRFGVLGALFHAMVLFVMMLLSYFDLRRLTLEVAALFLVLNAGLTWAALNFGTSYYGYGYLLASILGLIYAYRKLTQALARLPYMTFVANNNGLH